MQINIFVTSLAETNQKQKAKMGWKSQTFTEFIAICNVIYLSKCAHWVRNKLSEHSHSITKHISKHDNKYKDIPKF